MTRTPRGLAAFRSRDFRLFFAARFLAGLSLQIHNVGVGWLVYERTGSAMALGLVGLAAFLPALLLALAAGAVADRFDRRRIVCACWGLIGLVAIGLAVLACAQAAPVWPFFVLVTVLAGARSFANPAAQALLPNLVAREDFSSAVALSASAWQTSTIAGPAVGGMLYIFGAPVVFSSVALGFATAATLIGMIAARGEKAAREKPGWSSLLAGVAFIRARPVVLGAISLDLFAVLLGGATALLPIYARDILHTGPWGLGLLRSMPACGALAMTAWLAWRPLQRQAGKRLFAAVAVFGAATVVFGLSTHIVLSMAALFALGAADMISVVVRQTLVQLETPDAMRGRVSAVNSVFIGASNELGEFESGMLAEFAGAVPAVVAGGVGTMLVALLWTRLFPQLWRRDRLAP